MNFTIEKAIIEIKQGRIIIATDPNQENKGYFICAAEHITPKKINFMTAHGQGLIYIPMAAEIADRLSITAEKTKSIDHIKTAQGNTANEMAFTAVKCADSKSTPEDFRSPGHLFPLLADKNNGYAEAAIILCRLAGLKPCAVCCKTSAKLAERQLTLINTADLSEYHKKQ